MLRKGLQTIIRRQLPELRYTVRFEASPSVKIAPSLCVKTIAPS